LPLFHSLAAVPRHQPLHNRFRRNVQETITEESLEAYHNLPPLHDLCRNRTMPKLAGPRQTHLIETACPVMEAMVQEVTGIELLGMRHDISTVTGEKVALLTLVE
jgi:hypothetical protein